MNLPSSIRLLLDDVRDMPGRQHPRDRQVQHVIERMLEHPPKGVKLSFSEEPAPFYVNIFRRSAIQGSEEDWTLAWLQEVFGQENVYWFNRPMAGHPTLIIRFGDVIMLKLMRISFNHLILYSTSTSGGWGSGSA